MLLINKILKKLSIHSTQIKKGGLKILFIKSIKLFFLLAQLPLYLISIILIILIRLAKPWFLIRWGKLSIARLGHFAPDIEVYFCKKEAKFNTPKQKYMDIFFFHPNYICNQQLYSMFKKKVLWLPTFFLLPLYNVSSFLDLFISSGNDHEIKFDRNEERDIHDLFSKYKPHIILNNNEELKGKIILNEFGISDNDKFVCLIVRDNFYLNRHNNYLLKDYTQSDYRNGNIDRYILAAEELANRGYYVFRMGMNGIKPFNTNNKRIIDYANTKLRSDFMDVYLGSKCSFCISTGSGFDAIPYIFRKPIAYIQQTIGVLHTERESDLLLLQPHLKKKNNVRLNISEIFSSNVVLADNSDEFEKNNIVLKENSPEDIKNLAIEMDERLSGIWQETKEDTLLQKKFWSILQANLDKIDESDFNNVKDQGKLYILNRMRNLKKNAKFSSRFLKNNQSWIN